MAMDMDEKLFRQEHGWSLQLKSGKEITLTPGANEANEPLCVTDVFLVDPESTDGQGVVAAFVEIGTRNILLAALSSERPRVTLQTPVVLDEQFCFYLMRPGTDAHADADAEADAVVVQFQGYALPSADTKGKIEEEDEEEDDMIDDVNHEEEEEGDGNDTEEDDDGSGSDSHYEYDSRDDGEVCGLPLGVEIPDQPRWDVDDSEDEEEAGDRKVRAQAVRERRASHKAQRRRRRFATEAEGRSLGGPAPPGFAFGAERRRRVPLEAALLGIFVFVYVMAMVALYISG